MGTTRDFRHRRSGKAIGTLVVAVLLGTATGACSGDSGGHARKHTARNTGAGPAHVLAATYEKTSGAESARVRMTVTMPGAAQGGESLTITGVEEWNPLAADMTVHLGKSGLEPGMPKTMRMIMLRHTLYVDAGPEVAENNDGKRWVKMDLDALAEESGMDEHVVGQYTDLLDGTQQNPAQQIAILTESPDVRLVGTTTMQGVRARHYSGVVTVKDMLKSNKSFATMDGAAREQLLDTLKKSGVTSYTTDLWVNGENLPLRIDQKADTKGGVMRMSGAFSDYGVAADVKAPPGKDTVDLLQMLKDLGADPDGPDRAGHSA